MKGRRRAGQIMITVVVGDEEPLDEFCWVLCWDCSFWFQEEFRRPELSLRAEGF